jgi:purine-binding chemotaxis protein CheW
MGRMAEARKRARRKGGGEGGEGSSGPVAEASSGSVAEPTLPASDPGAVEAERPALVEPGDAPGEAPRAEGAAAGGDLVFPADAPPSLSGRIELPASGTAEEILARTEAAALAAEMGRGGEADEAAEAPQRAASISFFSAPARDERVAVEATEHLATFFLDREEYGVEVKLVQEIRRVTEITQVPRAPEFIRGVINLRGRIIPVIDLKKKLALGELQNSKAARIVVVKIQDRLIGMLVDGASQVLKVPVSSVEPPPDEVVEKGGDYIRGVAKLEKRLIILVDLQRVLQLEVREGKAPAGTV